MSNILPTPPSFVFGYWRPWKEDSNLFDSYFNYVKDVSLTKYGADSIGKYISQASQDQILAIDQLGEKIGMGMNIMSNQLLGINRGIYKLSDQLGEISQQIQQTNQALIFINKNIDILIEQQKLGNLLLQNISQLLRVPDSEKERQHSIELGIKFFVNAQKDKDLYSDALEELLRAESLMKQDYFVLHRIGCIYLYVDKFIDPEKALEYFLRAAKYASVESDPGAIRLANVLTEDFHAPNSKISNTNRILQLAADSYEKAAFTSYVLGKFSDAASYQSKAYNLLPSPQNLFLLSKYQIRNGGVDEAISNLSAAIDQMPDFAIGIFKEIDFLNSPEVLKLIDEKNKQINEKINALIIEWRTISSSIAKEKLNYLENILSKPYNIKISEYHKSIHSIKSVKNDVSKQCEDIDDLILSINKTIFPSYDEKEINSIIQDLILAKDFPLEKMISVYSKVKLEVEKNKLQIGSKYAGGIVFYLDKSGVHGFVIAEKDFGKAVWGTHDKQIFATDGGLQNTKRIAELASEEVESYFVTEKDGWFSQKQVKYTRVIRIMTAARICLEANYNCYTDWYLPNNDEWNSIYKNLIMSAKNLLSEKEKETLKDIQLQLSKIPTMTLEERRSRRASGDPLLALEWQLILQEKSILIGKYNFDLNSLYWSSTEHSTNPHMANAFQFKYGSLTETEMKNSVHNVRSIRAF